MRHIPTKLRHFLIRLSFWDFVRTSRLTDRRRQKRYHARSMRADNYTVMAYCRWRCRRKWYSMSSHFHTFFSDVNRRSSLRLRLPVSHIARTISTHLPQNVEQVAKVMQRGRIEYGAIRRMSRRSCICIKLSVHLAKFSPLPPPFHRAIGTPSDTMCFGPQKSLSNTGSPSVEPCFFSTYGCLLAVYWSLQYWDFITKSHIDAKHNASGAYPGGRSIITVFLSHSPLVIYGQESRAVTSMNLNDC